MLPNNHTAHGLQRTCCNGDPGAQELRSSVLHNGLPHCCLRLRCHIGRVSGQVLLIQVAVMFVLSGYRCWLCVL